MGFSGQIFCVTDQTLNMFTRINFDALSKVEQAEISKLSSPLLNSKRIINIIGRFGSF